MLHNCNYCDYTSSVKSNLRRHIKNKHENHATTTFSVQQNQMQTNRAPVTMSIGDNVGRAPTSVFVGNDAPTAPTKYVYWTY